MNSLLNMGLVLSIALLVLVSVREIVIARENKKRANRRKQRELERQIKLQKKIDEFETYKSRVEEFEDCNGDCMECKEFNYIKYENCKYKDEGYQNAKKYFDERGQTMRNIRITLQDYTVASVLELYGQA